MEDTLIQLGAGSSIVVRHYATNWQVAGSIPDSVVRISQWHNPSGRTMAPGLTQLLTKMSTRCVRLTTLQPSCAVVMKSGNLNFLEPSGPLQACNGTALPLPLIQLAHWNNDDTQEWKICTKIWGIGFAAHGSYLQLTALGFWTCTYLCEQFHCWVYHENKLTRCMKKWGKKSTWTWIHAWDSKMSKLFSILILEVNNFCA